MSAQAIRFDRSKRGFSFWESYKSVGLSDDRHCGNTLIGPQLKTQRWFTSRLAPAERSN
jgi:hypothetical protein